MNTETPRPQVELETVLAEYVTAVAAPSHATLLEWIGRYPQYREELIDFTESWSLSEALPEPPWTTTDEALVERSLGILREVLGQGADAPIASLLAEAREQGLSPAGFAARTGLGPLVLRKLERRLIRVATIPREAVEAVAAAIGRDAPAVAAYLHGPPLAPGGASYFAPDRPAAAEPQDFAQAVREDSSMSPEQRQRWLDLTPPGA